MKKDPVTPTIRAQVLARDGGCVAAILSGVRDRGHCRGPMTLDHVKDQPRMGKRAPSDLDHLVTLCWHHHLDGWATSHRPELRVYLRGVAP